MVVFIGFGRLMKHVPMFGSIGFLNFSVAHKSP
jgi:hypothetical protein